MQRADPAASPAAETRQRQPATEPAAMQTAAPAAESVVAVAGPEAAARRELLQSIAQSPRVAAQRQQWRGTFGGAAQLEAMPSPPPNRSGLPDGLKAGIESLSGMAMDHVQVHRNSSKPAQLNALAYAQGSDIHLAPGQEQHLPHEAWHVVQQAQGRVRPTLQMKQGTPVNDDPGLEREADVMGARAAGWRPPAPMSHEPAGAPDPVLDASIAASPAQVAQRNEESKKLLTKLAQPQVFEGPTFDVQTAIVESLEEALAPSLEEAEKTKDLSLWAQTNLGGIVLSSTPGDLEELISRSALVDLAEDKMKIGRNVFDLVPEKTRAMIVQNTLATMEKAGQLEYLRTSGLIGEEWKVVVEVHYYRDRSTSQLNLHKDTAGQTLFVNLNFQNAEEIAGPEFIVNPHMGESYMEHRRTRLPGVFNDDLDWANAEHGEPKEIGMSRVPKGGVVAFVDEAIHHKTPTIGHRKASAGTIRLVLGRMHEAEYKQAFKAFDNFRKRNMFFWGKSTFDSYLKVGSTHVMSPDGWYAFLTGLEEKGAEFDRTELTQLLPKDHKLDKSFVDACIELGGLPNFGRASFQFARKPETGVKREEWEHVPVKKEGKPPLKRQMSESLLEGKAPKPAVGRRTFFRTWVRAVKK